MSHRLNSFFIAGKPNARNNSMKQLITFFTLLVVAISAGAAPVVYEGPTGAGKGRHIVFIASDHESKSEEILPALARILAKHHGFKCTVLFGIDPATGEIKPGQSN